MQRHVLLRRRQFLGRDQDVERRKRLCFEPRKPTVKLTSNQQVLHHRGNYQVWRIRLAPGETTPWHRDPFHRVTVVLNGDLLEIEFRDGGEPQAWKISAGEVDWSEPSDSSSPCGKRREGIV